MVVEAMLRPKVTVAMPVYNGGEYFELALQSALAQDYDNIEIVVVNDGSTDGGETDSIARRYGTRIRYFHQENRGVAGAMNTVVANMTGDYFTWLSHDDIHLPNKVRRQVAYRQRLAKSDAILISDYDLIDSDGKLMMTIRLPHRQTLEVPMLPLMQGWVNGCTLFIPTHLLREYGPFDERLRYTQDYDLWNKILTQHDFFHQPEVLVQYRLHPGQDSHKPQAVTEGDALWIRMLDARTDGERVQLFGSRRRFSTSMAAMLDTTPYKMAAEYARAQVSCTTPQTLVSVVVPFRNEIPLACRALRSALAQTHPNIEVIAVDDGSTEGLAEMEELARQDTRLHLIRQENSGPGAARNRGMREASGEYIAFLDADDQFLPHKVRRQLQLMQRSGHRVSHTSYYVSYPTHFEDLGLVRSGAFSGDVYPQIISNCPIATPTTMIHRSVVDAGFEFSTTLQIAEDVLAWIELSMRHGVLGIDEPLSIVEWSETSGALQPEKTILGLMNMLSKMHENPLHNRHTEQIASLAHTLQDVARRSKVDPKALVQSLVRSAFGDTA